MSLVYLNDQIYGSTFVSVFGTVEASAVLRRCCSHYRDRHAGKSKEGVLCYLSVRNTINIITYTDV